MTARETRDSCLDESVCTLPCSWPYPRPGGWAMLLLPLAYIIMGVCYFIALRSPTNGFWYPPIAFGKLMLLVYGPRALVPVLGAELALMGVQYQLLADMGFTAAGLVSLATTAEALFAWWLLRRFPVDARLRQAGDLHRLLVFGGLLPNLAGALLGIGLLNAFVDYGQHRLAPAAFLWTFGDFVTTVTWMPAFILWVGPLLCGKAPRWPAGRQLIELLLILLVSAATCVLVAQGIMHRPHLHEYNLKFLCFLPLIWAGVRFGLAGASASLAVASTAWAMLYGNASPLSLTDLAVTIEQVQVFNLALGIGGLLLGWAIDAERNARDVARQLSCQLQANEAHLHDAFAAVAAAQQREARAGEIKYRLISAVSHELRTPLTPMALVLSELAARNDLPADVKEPVEMALTQVEREAAVVEELLEYADLMCGAEMHYRDTTWQEVIGPVRQTIDRAAGDANTCIHWTLPSTDCRLWVDPRKLARAALHTIRHAMTLCQPGQPVQITSVCEHGDFKLECHVPTQGAAHTAQALEPFAATDQKLNSTVTGLGLALATARLIAQRHSGALQISESSDSTTFTLQVRCNR